MDREGLTPLERIELRDLLQDRWRDQVRLITLLSLARYDVMDADAANPSGTHLLDATSLELAVERARSKLESVELAMRCLDDGSYGWCITCACPIGFSRLVQVPEESVCDGCRVSLRSSQLGAATSALADCRADGRSHRRDSVRTAVSATS